jgi:hypothetical protein
VSRAYREIVSYLKFNYLRIPKLKIFSYIWYNTLVMNRKWHPNWLMFFTIALFVTALTMFIATFRDQFGLKKCVYGDGEYTAGQTIPDEPRCFCDEKGEVVCEEIETESSLETTEYINEDLDFSSTFLSYVDVETNFENMRFGEVSTVDRGLRIVVERLSKCNDQEELPPQIGYYMFDGTDLDLTTSTNLLDEEFNRDCMVSNTFLVHGLSEVESISYQGEGGRVLEADICVYEGRVLNIGDAFVAENGEVIICE